LNGCLLPANDEDDNDGDNSLEDFLREVNLGSSLIYLSVIKEGLGTLIGVV